MPQSCLGKATGEQLPVLCLEGSASTPKARFGFSWFVPAIQKHRNALLQVVITSFLCSCWACSIHC